MGPTTGSLSFRVFSALLTFLCGCLLFQSAGLWLGRDLGALPFFLAVCGGLLTAFGRFGEKKSKYAHLQIILGFLAVLGITFFLDSFYFDVSYDGSWYHKEAILQMANGWNPYYDKPLIEQDAGSAAPWINNYAKGFWIIGVAIYKAFGHIELAKAPHLLLAVSVYLLVFSLGRSLAKRWCYLLALFAALQPVVVTQMFTFLVDGLVASVFTIIFSLGILLFFETNVRIYVSYAMAIILLVNLKATGLAFAGIGGLSLLVAAYFHKKICLRPLLAASLISGGVAAIVGFNPYFTNLKRHGNLIYPFSKYSLSGVTPKDSMLAQHLPEGFLEKNRFQKFIYSLFSESSNEAQPLLKVPFFVMHGESSVFYSPDVRLGGFGPLFSGIFLLSLFVPLSIRKKSYPKKHKTLLAVPFVVLVLSVLSNPEAWWARYAPQFYLFPLYSLGLLVARRNPLRWIERALLAIMIVALIINTAMILENSLRYQTGRSGEIAETLQGLRGKLVQVDFGPFRALRSRLMENGINYSETTEPRGTPYKIGQIMVYLQRVSP